MTTCKIDGYGTKRWYNEAGKLHREDGPAIEWYGGVKEWYVNGRRHRDDGPAVEWTNGSKEWWIHGLLHREDGPAVEHSSGTVEWWCNGSTEWRYNGLLHRLDGPAIEDAYGNKEWYRHGEHHREDGPAVELTDGRKEWWYNDAKYDVNSLEEFQAKLRENGLISMSEPKSEQVCTNDNWIPIQVIPDGQYLIAYCANQELVTIKARYNLGCWLRENGDELEQDKVKYYRPLPKPPEK